jgi:hypothetical protein
MIFVGILLLKLQNICGRVSPPLVKDNDPRLFTLIKQGECTYVRNEQMNPAEKEYVNRIGICNALSEIAGTRHEPLTELNLYLTLSLIVNRP